MAYVTRLLSVHGFHFRDLGLAPGEGDRALTAVRLELGRIAQELASRQPPGDDALVALLARPAVDLLAYAPPRGIVYFAAGRMLELGWSGAEPEGRLLPRWLRLTAALQVHGIPQLLSSEQKFIGLGALGGVELEALFLDTPVFHFRLALRGGWILASGDDFASAACIYGGSNDRIGRCSGPVAESGVVVAALEGVRLQVMAQWYPAIHDGETGLWQVSPSIGLQWSY